eukprot:5784174-Ditylum_brightwellii.AAC.1
MGWCESPPTFCSSTETSRDVMTNLMTKNAQLEPRKFEHYMLPTSAEKHSASQVENSTNPPPTSTPNKTLLE